MMTSWKTETYPSAWQYMEECAAAVRDPGFIINPWGRKRIFPRNIDGKLLNSYERQAQNFPG